MTTDDPMLPDTGEWRAWDVVINAELHAGKQSRVFDALLDGERSAVKLTDSRFSDGTVLTTRMKMVESLGTFDARVIAPTRIDGGLVQPIGNWLMTATPFVTGEQLDGASAADATRLGRALARLHLALRSVDSFAIPTIAALETIADDRDRSSWQPLHGDFSTKNVIATSRMLRVFDFDDCGMGPTEYDVANSLYMVMFDSEVTNRPEHYDAFRPAFLAGYTANNTTGSETRLSETAVDDMIATRIDALRRWLADLSTAPIGIRTSTPEWLETLASFVTSHAR